MSEKTRENRGSKGSIKPRSQQKICVTGDLNVTEQGQVKVKFDFRWYIKMWKIHF